MKNFTTHPRFARLHLNTTDIKAFVSRDDYFPMSVVISNATGSIELCMTKVTWRVDLRAVMGDMWEHEGKYALQLAQINTIPFTESSTLTSGNPLNIAGNKTRAVVAVYMSGLNWLNGNFSVKTGTRQDLAHMANLSAFVDGAGDTLIGTWSNYDVGGIFTGNLDTRLCETASVAFIASQPIVEITMYCTPEVLGRVVQASDTGLVPSSSRIMAQYRACFNIIPLQDLPTTDVNAISSRPLIPVETL